MEWWEIIGAAWLYLPILSLPLLMFIDFVLSIYGFLTNRYHELGHITCFWIICWVHTLTLGFSTLYILWDVYKEKIAK